jgi:aminocarboxymuconate-semialdehyde decarboxylase
LRGLPLSLACALVKLKYAFTENGSGMAPTRCIDMHAHFYGGGLERMLAQRTTRPCLRETGRGPVMLAMNGEFPFTPAHHDHVVGLADMDAHAITRRMLTFPGALCADVLPVAEALPAIRAFNDHMAGLRERTGGRITALAGLPLADMDQAARELVRVRRGLRLPGAILPSNYFDTIAQARQLEPVLKAADETGALLMLHPGLMVGEPPATLAADHPQYRTSAVALQAQASQVVLTLVLSDLLDAFPRIAFQVINLGGTVPFIFERMESIARHRNADTPFPTARLRRLWYDAASLGPRALEAAVKLYGADRIMAGSDYPIFHDAPLDAIRAAAITDEDKEQVAWRTAEALLERQDALGG